MSTVVGGVWAWLLEDPDRIVGCWLILVALVLAVFARPIGSWSDRGR